MHLLNHIEKEVWMVLEHIFSSSFFQFIEIYGKILKELKLRFLATFKYANILTWKNNFKYWRMTSCFCLHTESAIYFSLFYYFHLLGSLCRLVSDLVDSRFKGGVLPNPAPPDPKTKELHSCIILYIFIIYKCIAFSSFRED